MCTTTYKNEDNTSENTQSYIIKKRSNNKVSFVEFILNSRQFKLMTTGSQPHGARWPRFNCVQMIETMSSELASCCRVDVSRQFKYLPPYNLTRKRGNCECIATLNYPTPHQSFSTLITTPFEVAKPIYCRIIAFLLLITFFYITL